MDLLFTFSCIVLHAISLMSLAFIHRLDATFLLLSRFFYDFHLRIFMHMRASESYIYSLSFPVRGAWSMDISISLYPHPHACVHLNIPPKTHSFSVSSCPSSTPTLHFSSSFSSHFSHPSKHQKKTSTRTAVGDAQNSNPISSLAPKLQNPSKWRASDAVLGA